ncbi:hypothetical protein [Edaphobacter aggregans]|uniref:hypothetical protein n=1 Tax=Edaphobacter aggregans TaxID=570835 RepID=UPI00055397B1|nr:hypothetical protein [Edaphobacter aggregans]
MSVEKPTAASADVDQKQWYRVGGIAALVLGIAYIIIFPLYAHIGVPPIGGEAWFKYLPGKTTVWWAILGLSVFTDFLFVPVAFALYLALKEANKNAMLLAMAFVGLFVVLDLAVTWSHYASMLILYSNYSRSTDDVQRAGYVAAADYASAVLASPLEIVYAIVTLSFGILVIGFVMMRGVFNKTTAYLGLATGILGIVSVAGLSLTIIMNALFATAWILFVGYRLHRLAKE